LKSDANRHPTQNTYLHEVEWVGGQVRNVEIRTYPDDSRYGKHNREECLRRPVDDRNDPPCRFCG
jgi:hypothetical protein